MKKEEEENIFAPWEKEKDFKSRGVKKSIPPKNQKARLSSKPKPKDHEHLEMYILSREKERLEKYGSTLGRRVKSIADSWKKSKFRMYELQKEGARVGIEGIEEVVKTDNSPTNNTKKKQKQEGKKRNVQKKEWNY
ncbi:hypothetical protein KGY73_08785 [bacterium]|nr:hypothetical protein [bacterium]